MHGRNPGCAWRYRVWSTDSDGEWIPAVSYRASYRRAHPAIDGDMNILLDIFPEGLGLGPPHGLAALQDNRAHE